MATVNVNAKLNISADLTEAKKKLEQFANTLNNLKQNTQNMSQSKLQQAQALAGKMSQAQAVDTSAMSTKQKERHLREMMKLQQQYYQYINQVTSAEIRALNTDQQIAMQLQQNASAYGTASANVTRYTQSLNSLATESEQASQAVARSARDIAKSLGGTKAEQAQREDMLKDHNAVKARIKEIQAIKVANRTEEQKKELEGLRLQKKKFDAVERIEQKYTEHNAKLDAANAKLEQERAKRNQLYETILNQAVVDGKITEQQKQHLLNLNQEIIKEEEITQEKKKQEALESGERVQAAVNATNAHTAANNKLKKSFLGKVTAATVYYMALRQLRRLITSVIRTVKELDKSITEVAMVTSLNREQAWQLVGAYQALAYQVGSTTDEIAKLSVYFFRQGRSAADALELTRVAAIAAKVASIDMTESANYLTSAINGFGMAANQAMEVSDRFAALGASSASSYEEMAKALSKVAPSAKVAGVGIDFMMGILAKGIETTREAPENIGTAFKTVFARMTQIKEFGATLDDSTGVNKVEEALATANVTLRDSEGNFRDMESVLTELGYKFEGLSRNQQAYIATALAGTRQQSRLLAVMQNFSRTMELVDISTSSVGATLAQHAEYSDGMQAATARLANSWEKLILAFTQTESIIRIVDTLSDAISFFADEIDRNGELLAGFAAFLSVTLVGALIAVKIAALKAAGALTAATFGLNLIIPAILGLSVLAYSAFRESASAAERLKQKSEETSEAIKQTQVDIYNYRKSANEIDSLRKRYNELNNTVIKSAEETKELEEVGTKLKAILEDEYNLVVKGDLDDEALRVLDLLSADETEAIETQIDLGKNKLKDYAAGFISELDSSDRQAIQMFMIEDMFGISYLEASIEERDAMMEIANSNFEEYLAEYRRIGTNFNLRDVEIFTESGGFEKVGKQIQQYRDDSGIGFGNFSANRPAINAAARIYNTNKSIFQDLMGSPQALLDAATSALGAEPKSDEELLQGIELYFKNLKMANENLMDVIADTLGSNVSDFNMAIVEMRGEFQDLFNNNLTQQEQSNLWKRFFGLDENSQRVLAGSLYDLSELYKLGLDNLTNIVNSRIVNNEGKLLSIAERMDIASILYRNGLNEQDIARFFDHAGEFTADRIGLFLSTVEGRLSELELSNLGSDLFTYFTGGMTPQKFYDQIEKAKNQIVDLTELQKKFLDNSITAEEMGRVQDYLGQGEFLDAFLRGEFDAADFVASQVETIRNGLLDSINATRQELATMEQNDASRIALENNLALFEDMYANLDAMISTGTMDEYYQAQIDYIQQMNQDLQEQINLEQKRMDMNRSMLSLNRQIRALESDTSYGAQARLDELRTTRQRELTQREAYIMDTVANQAIAELQNKIQGDIKDATTRTADATEAILAAITSGDITDTTIEAYTGTTVRSGGGRSALTLSTLGT